MREPVIRRTQSAVSALLISTCLCASALAAESTPPVAAASAAGDTTVYAMESAKASRTLLLDVTHAGKRMVAVGDRGHIIYSDDQGKTWTQAKVPTRQLLTAVYFVDDQHGWAVGHDAQILASSDGGATWIKQFEDLKREAPLLDVWFKDLSTGIAVGAYGALLETTDGGQHWQDIGERLDNEDQFHLNGIAYVKDAGVFIVGEQGSMFRSSDDGQTWEKLEGPYHGSLFGAVATAESNTLLAYGLRGNLFRSTDFGSTWEPIALQGERGPLEFGIANAALLPDNTIVLVGNGGSVMRSTDDGLSFTVANRPDRISLAAVTEDDKGNLILVGQGGVRVTSPTGADLAQQ
jgi:photosystem II stability/assembly factor-like uncharacterized protein